MVAHNVPVLLVGIFFLARKSCSAYLAPTCINTSSYISSRPTFSRSSGSSTAGRTTPSRRWREAGRTAVVVASASSGEGFCESKPNPAYYPDGDDEDYAGQVPPLKVKRFEPISAAPKGIGTLFENGDEMIRELSSQEYTDVLRDWAPVAGFAANEALDPEIRRTAECIRNVLRGMAQMDGDVADVGVGEVSNSGDGADVEDWRACMKFREWQPRRNSDYTKLDSKWAFGSPIGAIKGGMVDAMACLQVSEDGGVVIEWICGNPITLGVQGNAVDWLMKGVSAICGKKLDLPVSIAKNARGEYGSSNDDRNKKEEKR